MNNEDNIAAKSDLLHNTSTLLAVVGGLASVLVGIGYLYYFAYFRTLGTSWLMHELTVGQITFGSATPLTIVVVYAMVLRVLPSLFRMRLFGGTRSLFEISDLLRFRLGAGLVVCGLVVGFVILKLPLKYLALTGLANPAALAPVLLAIGSAFLGVSAVDASRSPLPKDRQFAAIAVSWFAITGLVLTPIFTGIASGTKVLTTSHELNCATPQNEPQRCFPIVYAGANRVYCISKLAAAKVVEIRTFQWPELQAIHLTNGSFLHVTEIQSNATPASKTVN